MNDIAKIKVDGEPESSYQLYPRNNEFAKRAGGNGGDGGSGVQSDWNQNDTTKLDYVKNRPFYSTKQVQTVNWDGDKTDKVYVGNMFYKVSDLTPISKEFVYCVQNNGIEICETLLGDTSYDGLCLISDGAIICYDTSKEFVDGMTFPETGTYFTHTGNAYVSKLECTAETVKQLDAKFIPDMDGVILNSSTTDSTKKFKITVDDSGTITATEVT